MLRWSTGTSERRTFKTQGKRYIYRDLSRVVELL